MDEEKLKKIFSEKIKFLILDKEINQKILADEVGIPQSTLSDWLNCKILANIYALNKLADFFGVTTDYLLGRED